MRQPIKIIEPGHIKVGVCVTIPAVLREFGIDDQKFLDDFGLSASVFQHPDNVVSYSRLAELLTTCAHVTKCEAFAVMVGKRATLEMLGDLGVELRKARNVGQALMTAGEILTCHDRGAVLELVASSGHSELRYTVSSPLVKSAEQITDGVIAVCCNVMRELCGPDWKPTGINLTRRVPKRPELFISAFPCGIYFNKPVGSVRFASHWLDAVVQSEIEFEPRSLERDSTDGLVEQVISCCIKQLSKSDMSSDTIASELSMTRRTLHRRLAQSGTNYRTVLQKAKIGFACRMIRDTDMPITAVASQVGYSELAAFTRAFRSFSGLSPSEFRLSSRSVDVP